MIYFILVPTYFFIPSVCDPVVQTHQEHWVRLQVYFNFTVASGTDCFFLSDVLDSGF